MGFVAGGTTGRDPRLNESTLGLKRELLFI